jgi:hypothetical protein
VTDDRTRVRAYLAAPDGTKTPFSGTGLRIVVARNTWIELDLDLDRRAGFGVEIGGRCRRETGADWPKMRVEVHAANIVSVLARSTQKPDPSVAETFVVDAAEVKGDLRDLLRKTSSGDPVGELTLQRPERQRIESNTLLIEYDDVSTTSIVCEPDPDALLRIRVSEHDYRRHAPGDRFRSLSMTIHPHACNLVSLSFREGEAFVPEGDRDVVPDAT